MKKIKVRVNEGGDMSILIPKSFPKEVKEIFYTAKYDKGNIVFSSGTEPFTITDFKNSICGFCEELISFYR